MQVHHNFRGFLYDMMLLMDIFEDRHPKLNQELWESSFHHSIQIRFVL